MVPKMGPARAGVWLEGHSFVLLNFCPMTLNSEARSNKRLIRYQCLCIFFLQDMGIYRHELV